MSEPLTIPVKDFVMMFKDLLEADALLTRANNILILSDLSIKDPRVGKWLEDFKAYLDK